MVQATTGSTGVDPGTGDPAARTAGSSGPGKGIIVIEPPINPHLPVSERLWEGLTFAQRQQIKQQQLIYAQTVCTAAASAYKAIAGIIPSG